MLWVKGSGGDLGSIKRSGFATLYLDKVLSLTRRYRGVQHEDEMVAMYPLCTFNNNPTAASIDTPLHGYLPFPHVDHLHPDWGIALAASANGLEKMEQFNQEFGHKIAWVPWQRPGFELGMMLVKAVEDNPGCDGIVPRRPRPVYVGRDAARKLPEHRDDHRSDRPVYRVAQPEEGPARVRRREAHESRGARVACAELMPVIRGAVSQKQRLIGTFSDNDDVMEFVNSQYAKKLAHLGNQLPGPLHPHQDPAHVHRVGSEDRRQ